jgi:hypothetical protein
MEGWMPRQDAYRIINEARQMYREKFGKENS